MKEKPQPPADWSEPNAWHDYEDSLAFWTDVIRWAGELGNWDAQIKALKDQGYLNGESTTYGDDYP